MMDIRLVKYIVLVVFLFMSMTSLLAFEEGYGSGWTDEFSVSYDEYLLREYIPWTYDGDGVLSAEVTEEWYFTSDWGFLDMDSRVEWQMIFDESQFLESGYSENELSLLDAGTIMDSIAFQIRETWFVDYTYNYYGDTGGFSGLVYDYVFDSQTSFDGELASYNTILYDYITDSLYGDSGSGEVDVGTGQPLLPGALAGEQYVVFDMYHDVEAVNSMVASIGSSVELLNSLQGLGNIIVNNNTLDGFAITLESSNGALVPTTGDNGEEPLDYKIKVLKVGGTLGKGMTIDPVAQIGSNAIPIIYLENPSQTSQTENLKVRLVIDITQHEHALNMAGNYSDELTITIADM